ncbi:hypothetical protein N8T08_003007 [Aspergillus melleus]|uniref:Uncharacterized protein n=1 Tax=Aspergillus melleus TaxID=138277 RepID=A0ACC3B7P4_9EURO|nr:hypothetical protein N8T08_003007 [Aspergillus melleus]
MCNFYENVYHYANCKDPNEHYIHISFQGDPADRCKAGPHEQYVPISAQCHRCYPTKKQNDAPERPSSDASESEPDNPEPDENDDSDGKKIPEFSVTWKLPTAIADVQDMETFMLEALTLTRTECSVKAMPCQVYIQEEYGALGLVLLENIFSALSSPGNGYEDSTMEIYAGNNVFLVALSEKLSHLKDMLLWLCLSFVGPKDGSVCISTAAMMKNSIILMPLQPIETTDQLMSEEYWHEMFEAAVIAQDPRLEPQPCMLLEMGFKMMVRLSGVSWKVLHDGGFLLRGPFTALTPIRELGNEHIMWHFEILRPGDRFEPPRKWMQTLLMHQLRSKKALV